MDGYLTKSAKKKGFSYLSHIKGKNILHRVSLSIANDSPSAKHTELSVPRPTEHRPREKY
jgi:hypothetical protein